MEVSLGRASLSILAVLLLFCSNEYESSSVLLLLTSLWQWRFALLCLAALEAPLQLPLSGSLYGTDITFIANDWQAALVSVYLAGKFRPYGTYKEARSIIAIHNLRHQACLCPILQQADFHAVMSARKAYLGSPWQRGLYLCLMPDGYHSLVTTGCRVSFHQAPLAFWVSQAIGMAPWNGSTHLTSGRGAMRRRGVQSTPSRSKLQPAQTCF